MKNKNHLKLLIVAEQETDFAEVKKLLQCARLDFKDYYCKSLKSFTTQIHEVDPHLIILYKVYDVLTPEMVSNYLNTFQILIPVLLFIPPDMEDMAIDYLGETIDDYVVITHQKRIPIAVTLLAKKKTDFKAQRQSLRFMLESEKRWQALFQNEPECIIIVSPEGLIKEVNASGFELLEAENSKKIIHYPFIKFIHPDDVKIYKKFHQSVSRGNSCKEQFRLVSLKGKTIWLSATGVSLRDAEKNILSLLIIGKDISVFYKLKNDFKEKENHLNRLLEQIPAGAFQANTEGDFVFVNQKWCKLTGLQPEEAIGTGWSRAIHAAERDAVLNDWNQLVKSQLSFNKEFRFVNTTGHMFWVAVSAVEIKDEAGILTGFIGIVNEINNNRHLL